MANVVQQRRRSPWQFRSNYSAAFLLSAATVLVLVSRVDAVRPPSLEADVDASGQLHAARDAGESASKKPRGSSLASASSQQTSSLKDKLDDNQKDNKPARVGADLVDENQKEKAEAESTSKKAGASDEKNGNDKPVDKEKSSKQNAAANKDPKSVKAAPQEKVKVDAKDGLQLHKDEDAKAANDKVAKEVEGQDAQSDDKECDRNTTQSCSGGGCSGHNKCIKHFCFCINACIVNGSCVATPEPTVCEPQTGGTCRFLECKSSRNSTCNGGNCECTSGNCAHQGACIPEADFSALGNASHEEDLFEPGADGESTDVKFVVKLAYFLAPVLQCLTMAVLICLGELKRSDRASEDFEDETAKLADGDREDEVAQALLDYVPEGTTKIEVDYGGAVMRFKSKILEGIYMEKACERGIILGSQLLAISAFLAGADRAVGYMRQQKCGYDALQFQLPELGALGAAAFFAMGTSKIPKSGMYTLLILFWFFYVLARGIPPLRLSCGDMRDIAKCSVQEDQFEREMREQDCSLLGHTAQQAMISFVLLTPWIIPFLTLMHGVWFWVLGLYPLFVLYDLNHNETYDRQSGYVASALLLAGALILSVFKKFNVEKAHRLGFVADLELKKASYKMYKIFEYMCPVHVIPKMLQNPGAPIAEPIERVSILFVMICDFDQYASKLEPAALLEFLNAVFGAMDDICTKYRVQKVETVGEEYVACVGALPADQTENKEKGHTVILSRLLVAAHEMLEEVQNAPIGGQENVKLQMGIHSGPIVAGVIGMKLPRYRLFGDTINTTARFMQKGMEGRLQFSVDTKNDLPPEIEFEYRDGVEMKGKGKVDAWLLKSCGNLASQFEGKPDSFVAGTDTVAQQSSTGGKKNSKVPSLFKMMNKNDDEGDDEENMEIEDPIFEQVLSELAAEEMGDAQSRTSKAFLRNIPGYNAMTPEMEAKWFRWFHRTKICTDLLYRLDKQALVISVLTVFETWYLVHRKSWDSDHKIFPGWLRIPVFETVRTAAFLTLIFWRMAVHSTKLVFRYPLAMQIGMVLSNCWVCILMYVSYDVMIITTHANVVDGVSDEEGEQLRFDQMFALVFMLEFQALTTWDTTLFTTSWVYVMVAILLMGMTWSQYGQLYFHTVGRILFVCNAILTSFIAWEVEQSSRGRYKSRAVVKTTELRVAGILNTLMPPKLIKELRENATSTNPSHTYRNASIAQSDLCGFTQLSAKRQPHEVVEFVSDLFGRFDQLCEVYGIYKVETIGDAYIAGMAEHTLTDNNSVISVIHFGFAMIDACEQWAKGLGEDVTCRVGVHHGACIGGIVGSGMQRYHLFGDLMNVIEIMESCGVKAQVHVSPACKGAVQYDHSGLWEPGGGFDFEERQEEHLTTSKDKIHKFEEVGGKTFLVIKKPNFDSLHPESRAAAVAGLFTGKPTTA